MPKSQVIKPEDVRQPGKVTFDPIPLNQYTPDFEKERKLHGKDGLTRMLMDMLIIREFETMLDTIKKQGSWQGIEYNHRGPAHLSIGQEAASVGQCAHLEADDFIFGSHRSHGEILAKCLSASRKLPEDRLAKIMEESLGGDTLRVVEKGHSGTVRTLAERFIVYGTMAEIFARKAGFNRGLGGSMHAFFIPFGSMPNNAIVGGSGDISVGAGLFKRINRRPGIVIGNIGDASAACGPVWEGIMLASMDQYRTLWDSGLGGAPPVMINFFNNFYGMGGQTVGETMGYNVLARLGAGVNPENMHAERVDGYNPLAVADAVARKKKILTEGRGPVLMDTITYRLSGHSPSDASTYRTKEEIDAWAEADSIPAYAGYLREHGVVSEDEVESMKAEAVSLVRDMMVLAVDDGISPRVEPRFIEGVMFSNGSVERFDRREPEILIPKGENPRVLALAKRERFGLDGGGKALPAAKIVAYRDALFEAMLHRFYEDPTMVAYGEDNRDWGGAFAVYRGLTESLPYHRFFNSPIAEGAIVGSGVGYAMCGGRAVVELMYCDFLGRAGDEIFNQVSKWQAMSAGILKMPLTVRVSVGSKYGAQHSQDWTGIIAHIPGLKAMFPATPCDAKGMLNLALRGTDPVIFFESQKLYGIGELFEPGGIPEGYYEVPEGEPAVRRAGSDLTIITLGAALYTALEAAEELESRYGIGAEVIDLRFINPLKYDTLLRSVDKTGKVLLVSDACERGSFLHTVASNITQAAFDRLDAPPAVVGARNWITPAAEMEESFFPQKEWIIDTVHERILPLKGHTPSTVQTGEEILRCQAGGV